VRKKVLIAGLGIAVAASAAVILFAPEQSTEDPVPPLQHQPQLAHTAENPLFGGLPTRRAIGPSQGQLFSSPPPPPKPPAPVSAAPTPPAPPTPPALPYRVAGVIAHDGKAEVVLSKGDRVITVRPGETLEGGYRVGNIDADGVTLIYTPLGIAQHLPASFPFSRQQQAAESRSNAAEREASATDGPPALRWQGPERVRAGSQFQVVLKLSSPQPVRFSPLELSYDAKLLEPLAVRAGDYFSDGKLGYRVTRGGSILVGASKTNVPAADVDLLIVTFKAIRTGEPAELKVSSIELTDLDGEVVQHRPPPTFRTSIQQ
jgi:hypothetical protein